MVILLVTSAMEQTSLFSPKQIAAALGVSESSVKRWCDAGSIASSKTAGGHRKIPLLGVIEFVKGNNCTLYHPELLGISSVSTEADGTLKRGLKSVEISPEGFCGALARGDIGECRRLLWERIHQHKCHWRVVDELMTSTLCRFGDAWECGNLEVYQERRACEICFRLIFEVREKIPIPAVGSPVAIGCAVEGDPYQLPTVMVETVLRECGWEATSLGSNLPFITLTKAVRDYSPKLVWLSVTTIPQRDRFVDEFNTFSRTIDPEVMLVIGGRALTDDVRPLLSYSTYCDRLHQIAELVKKLVPSIH